MRSFPTIPRFLSTKEIGNRWRNGFLILVVAVLVPFCCNCQSRQNTASSASLTRTTVSKNMLLVTDGKPFFPIGIYHVPIDELSRVASIGFNTVQGWGADIGTAREYLRTANRYHLKVVLELSVFLRGRIDIPGMLRLVASLKDEPALLAWYIVDEPIREEQLHAGPIAYREIRKIDPWHPILVVQNPPDLYRIASSFADVLGIDPYPIPYHPIREVTDWFQYAVNAVDSSKPVWLVVQAHDQTGYPGYKEIRGPTGQEVHNMIYQGIVNGAKGILFYAWDDGVVGLKYDPKLLQDVRTFCSELRNISPELSGSRTPIATSSADVFGALYTTGTSSSLFLVNTASGNRTVEFKLPTEQSGAFVSARLQTLSNGILRVNLKRLEAVRFESEFQRRGSGAAGYLIGD